MTGPSSGSTWGSQISQKALEGLIAFLIAIVIYLSIAFEWKMAAAALVALAHDIVITIGVYALTGFQVSPATVIGLLTILGYSLYDTVVVFDKVRENTAGLVGTRKSTYTSAANLALNQTLVRSINTSLIALLPVAAILVISVTLLGNGELKDLSLVLFVGMLSGTYSSICIATPVLVDLKEREPQFKQLTRQVALREAGGRAKLRKARAAAGSGGANGTGAGGTAVLTRPGRGGRRRQTVSWTTSSPMRPGPRLVRAARTSRCRPARTAPGGPARSGAARPGGPAAAAQAHQRGEAAARGQEEAAVAASVPGDSANMLNVSDGPADDGPAGGGPAGGGSAGGGSAGAADVDVSSVILSRIRDIPDYPQPGVVFKDITPLLADGPAFRHVVAALADVYAGVDKVAGIEARGFILAAPVACVLGSGFVPIRKQGKLPGPTYAESYDLEYGTATIEVHQDAFAPGDRVLLVDDVLATGGTAAASAELVRRSGATVAGIVVLLELGFLDGRSRLPGLPVSALVAV